MKKIVTILSLVLVFVVGLMATPVNAAALPENPPVIGEESTVTDFYSHWQPGMFGANRLNDKGVVMALTSGFGARAGFRTPYNVTDFEAQFDFSYLDPGTVAITFFGPQGSYISGNGAVLSIEFLKHTTEANKYLVAIQVGSGLHHVSLPEFILEEQGDWEDSAWKGYHLVAENDIITFSMKEIGSDVLVTINNQEFTVASSVLFAEMDDKTSVHYLVGALNMDNTIQTVTANYILDAQRRTYYETEGVFDTFKSNLIELEALLLEDLSVVTNVQAAQTINANLDIDTLYEFDKNFFKDRLDVAQATLQAAISELGGDIILDELESIIVQLESRVNAIVDYNTANQAINQLTTAKDKEISIDDSEFTPEQVTRFAELSERIVDADALIITKVHDLALAQIVELENSVLDLSTIEKVNTAIDSKNAVRTNLFALLEEEISTAFTARYDAAVTTLTDATNSQSGWIVGNRTYVIENNNTIQATFLGEGLGENGNGLFYELEKFDVRNFQMTLKVESLTKEAGGWISFGIMEKPEIFSTAEDSSVQDNKGLFFLIIPEGTKGARIEVYMLSLYSNRFFDAQRTETLHVTLDNDLVIDFSTVMEEVSGVIEEYLSISIGGDVMDADRITTRALRTSLSDGLGHLYIAGSGGTSASKNTVTIKLINGKEATAESLQQDYLPEPYLVTQEGSFEKGSSSDINIEFYNRELDFVVKVNGTVLAETNYTYANNVLKIKATYLETLEVGDYVASIETEGGSVSVPFTIDLKPVEPETPSNGISPWVWVGIGVGVVVLAGGVFLVLKKKKA